MMKLLTVHLARAIWLANINDFNPRGRKLDLIILPFILETYKFKKYPSSQDLIDLTKGISLEGGEFKNNDDEPIAIKLNVFSFGIVAETGSSTSDSDAFLETLLTQLHENFNLPHYDKIIRGKNYLSQLYIGSDKSLGLINPKLKKISEYLSKNITGWKVDYQMGGISFWADPGMATQVQPPQFILERQAQMPFSENRYFSSAPLQTDKHLELLNKIETILDI